MKINDIEATDEVLDLLEDKEFFNNVYKDMLKNELIDFESKVSMVKNLPHLIESLEINSKLSEDITYDFLIAKDILENGYDLDIDKGIKEIHKTYDKNIIESAKEFSEESVKNIDEVYDIVSIKDSVNRKLNFEYNNLKKLEESYIEQLVLFSTNESYFVEFNMYDTVVNQCLYKYKDKFVVANFWEEGNISKYYGYVSDKIGDLDLIVNRYLDLEDRKVKDLD